MHSAPDPDAAQHDQTAVFRIVDSLLDPAARPPARATAHHPVMAEAAGPAAARGPADRVRWTYPGRVATAFAVQRLARKAASAGELLSRARAVEAQAAACARRVARGGPPNWPVDLAPPQPHLVRSLDVAVRQLPDRARTSRLAVWTDQERAVFQQTAATLAEHWPLMRDELAVTVRQLALLSGTGINGYTDFTVHGAVFVARDRLAEADGLPGHIRLAESLVHEGTHTRCNAAAAREPFLRDGEEVARLRVATPLRADHRPLAGLFQQFVVVVRCAELYSRLRGAHGVDEDAARRRQERLTAQARQAADGLDAHRSLLSPRGITVLDGLRDHTARIPQS